MCFICLPHQSFYLGGGKKRHLSHGALYFDISCTLSDAALDRCINKGCSVLYWMRRGSEIDRRGWFSSAGVLLCQKKQKQNNKSISVIRHVNMQSIGIGCKISTSSDL